MDDDEEIPLAGGNVTQGVVRVGKTVRRPMGPSSPVAHAVLRHLEAVGFEGAPRFLGVDDRGREILSFHEGRLLPEVPEMLEPDEGVARAARLIAEFHRAVEGFAPPETATWWTGSLDPGGGDHLLHGDLGPWNLLAADDQWVIIDWDSVSMGRLEWELAYALHTFVPLWPHSGYSDSETARRIAVFADDLNARAARGERAFVRMVAEGHATNWSSAARHVARRLPVWRDLL